MRPPTAGRPVRVSAHLQGPRWVTARGAKGSRCVLKKGQRPQRPRPEAPLRRRPPHSPVVLRCQQRGQIPCRPRPGSGGSGVPWAAPTGLCSVIGWSPGHGDPSQDTQQEWGSQPCGGARGTALRRCFSLTCPGPSVKETRQPDGGQYGAVVGAGGGGVRPRQGVPLSGRTPFEVCLFGR